MRLLAQRIAEGVKAFSHRRIVECESMQRQFDTLRPPRYSAPHL